MSLLRMVMLGAVAVAAVGLGGCVNVHPRYRAEAVVWDESILGEWRATNEDGEMISLRIEPREVGVDAEDGRINPDSTIMAASGVDREDARGASGPGERGMRQYLLRYETPDEITWTLEGYLLQAGGHRFLAFQLQDEFIEEHAGLVLPVHMLWRLEQTAGRLEFSSPKDGVAWVPAVEWADGVDDGGDRPIPLRTGTRRGIRVAESLDRVLAYHAAHAEDEEFWEQDASMVFARP